MTKKRIALALLAAVSVTMAGYGGTAAYLSSVDQANNQATVGHNDTTITEEFPDPTPTPMTENPSYTKKVWVTNQGQGNALVDCYVRVALSYSNSDIGQAVTLNGLNTSDWTYSGGYYYYNVILKKGESTTPLFTGFSIDSSKVNEKYQELIKDFDINVYEESVQSDGFSNAQEAFAHFEG